MTGGKRVNVTPKKHIPNNRKYIKPTALSPFLPRNKILLNEYNDDNPENTDTSLSGKDDMLYTNRDDFTGKTNDKKLQIMMKNKRRKHQKINKVMKVLIILKH